MEVGFKGVLVSLLPRNARVFMFALNFISLPGIDAKRLNAIESRLKEDILREAEQNDNNILVHDEEDGGIKPYFCSASKYTVQTAKEVFAMLKREGYKLEILRVPITAESHMVSGIYLVCFVVC